MTSSAPHNTSSMYDVRDAGGTLIARQKRVYLPDGSKRMAWQSPTGEWKCPVPQRELPLYASERVALAHPSKSVIVTEGASACEALWSAGYVAAGTLTGASGVPCDESLAVLNGRPVILWPDADESGQTHMLRLYHRLWRAKSVRWIDWPDAPEKGDAADAGIETIEYLIGTANELPLPDEPEPDTHDVVPLTDSPITGFNATVGVSSVLASCFGVTVEPGNTSLCIGHDEHKPSMSVLPDDRRVYCHKWGCPINNEGRGRDAYDLWMIGEAVNADR